MLDQISIFSAVYDRIQKLCYERSKNTTMHFYLDRIVELLTMDWIPEIISFPEQVLGKHSPNRNDNEVATGWKNKET